MSDFMDALESIDEEQRLSLKQKLELMGKIVTFRKIYKRTRQFINTTGSIEKNWIVTSQIEGQLINITGWVVGFRNIQNGESSYSGPEEGYEWWRSETLICMLVSPWPNNLPYKVPLVKNAFSLGGEIKNPNVGLWTEEDREQLRKEMKNFPRDKSGRWGGSL